jgi:4-diphosphocytidyl-2-C-methyl-D-erythritol kinase
VTPDTAAATPPRLLARLRAPAKLTWSLHVVGFRDGLHLLEAEMVSLDLADDLALFVPSSGVASIDMRYEDGSAVRPPIDVGANLVTRALALVRRAAKARVTKRIPLGGGLGGGSADAGAILRWAGLSDAGAAISLGGDVPFCVYGGRALVEGVGERVTPLPFVPRTLTLITCPFPVSTAACYEAYDIVGPASGSRNDLRTAAEAVEPRLKAAADWLAAEFGQPVELCGSGSSFFCEGCVNGDVRAWNLLSPVGELNCSVRVTVPRLLPWPEQPQPG